MKNIKYSIVIPTYNHLEDCLKPCIESVLKYTDLSQVEIIIVANGCKDGTQEYLMTLDRDLFKWFVFDEPLGYTEATNFGISTAKGEYVILLNNDVLLLDQKVNWWIDLMYQPFAEQEKVGITGPLKLHDVYVNHPVVIFFCAMIPRHLFFKFGLLDEIFSPGGGEDIDFTMKLVNAGYKCLQVPSDEKIKFTGTNSSIFPIWHMNNKTFSEMPEYGSVIIKKNGLINLKRYNKEIKLNLGSGYLGLQHYGFVSIDDKIQQADIVGDILDLGFENNTVKEIYCGHFINHLDYEKAVLTIKKAYDILVPGGTLIVEQPDAFQIFLNYTQSDPLTRIKWLDKLLEPMKHNGSVYTAKSMWDGETLKEHLEKAGFLIIIVSASEMIQREGCNFRIEARKPL